MKKLLAKLRELKPVRRRHIQELRLELQNLKMLLNGAILDSQGLYRLEAMLENAHVPVQYRDIFYKMFLHGAQLMGHTSQINGNASQTHAESSSIHGGGGGQLDPKFLDSKTPVCPVCIDCGGHAGLITDMILFCGGIAYTYEPNKYLHAILQKKYKNNPNVILSQQAVSNRNGTTQFFDCGEDILSQGNRIVESIHQGKSMFEVEVVDLSEVIEKEILKKHNKIYLLKLDIEGAEFDVLESLIQKGLHKHIDYIACETHERFFEDGDEKIAHIHNLIKTHNITNILLDWI